MIFHQQPWALCRYTVPYAALFNVAPYSPFPTLENHEHHIACCCVDHHSVALIVPIHEIKHLIYYWEVWNLLKCIGHVFPSNKTSSLVHKYVAAARVKCLDTRSSYILFIMLSDTITKWQVLTVSSKVNAVIYPIRCFNYWHFASFALHLIPEPTTVDIHVDGLNDVCTKEQDINFFFTGFSVLGTVREIFLPAVILFFFPWTSLVLFSLII